MKGGEGRGEAGQAEHHRGGQRSLHRQDHHQPGLQHIDLQQQLSQADWPAARQIRYLNIEIYF